MKVVRIVTRVNRGGPLRQLQALVPGLARLGIEGPVWAGDPARGEEDASDVLADAGADVVRVPGLRRAPSPFHDVQAFRWMLAGLREERPDVVHTHMGKAGALGRLAARAAGVRVAVHTFHGHHMAASGWLRAPTRFAEKRLEPLTTAAVCLSESQREDLVRRFHVLPPEKAVVIGPAIDAKAFRASVERGRVAEIRDRSGARAPVLLLWLGRFVPVKDPLLALHACARAGRGSLRGPPFHLVMAGDGPLRRGFDDRIVSVRAAASAPGAVPDPQNWIAAAAAVVISSRSEGTPIAALEAASLGVPVVATAVGGIPDVVRHDETGLLVRPGDEAGLADAMKRVATDPALRARLGARARAEADARFSPERLARETATLYEDCLRRAR